MAWSEGSLSVTPVAMDIADVASSNMFGFGSRGGGAVHSCVEGVRRLERCV